MGFWLNLGQIQKINAKKFPNTVALKDANRAFTYPQMNGRVNKLASSLFSLGLQKGDKIVVLLENCIEICELFLATAKTGIVIVPINFRLVSSEVEYIVNNSDAKAMVVHDQFAHIVEPIRSDLKNIDAKNYIIVGKPQDRYRPYENFISASTDTEPDTDVAPLDTWILIYTSGTTGEPKGILAPHRGALHSYDERHRFQPYAPGERVACNIFFVWELFRPLFRGAAVYVIPDATI